MFLNLNFPSPAPEKTWLSIMENQEETGMFARIFKSLIIFSRKFLFKVLSVGPIPSHIAFILDGNRTYAKKHNLKASDAGHRAGFLSLMSMLKYCREVGIKYATVFAFGIDNFNRKPEEIQYVMDLMLEKIEIMLNYESIASKYGVRIIFIGDLTLLNERLRAAAERAMEVTAKNTGFTILLCVAYSTRYEIVHAVRESCVRGYTARVSGKGGGGGDEEGGGFERVELSDIERCMFMSVAPDPDILVRTSGANRMSNFLIWQTPRCLLYSPAALWPEIGLRHLVWAILNFQRIQPFLQKKKLKSL